MTVLVFGLVWAGLGQAAKVELHGQFGAKLQTTNSWGMLEKSETPNLVNGLQGAYTQWYKLDARNGAGGEGLTVDSVKDANGNDVDLDDTWASLQFRLWAVASSDDGKVKGTWAMEVGSLRFGENGGLELRNDNENIEVRQMSLEFALPFGQSLGLRLRAGLNPYFVNRFLWNETAPGIDLMGKTTLGQVDTTFVFVWVRGFDNTWLDENQNNDFDAYAGVFIFDLAKVLNVDKAMAKVFFIPMNGQEGVSVPYNVGEKLSTDVQPWYLGGDAQFAVRGVDVDLGLIRMGGDAGDIDNDTKDEDFDGWFFYADLGYQVNEQTRVSFLFWWASGDDNSTKGDVESYMAVDTHTEGSVVLFEDGAFDDGYAVSSAPYLNQLGFQMYRLRVDYKATPKLSLAAALNYMKFDEDAKWTDANHKTHKEDEVGWELDLYAKYELYPGLTVDLAAGYLWAGDALDAWARKAVDNDYHPTGGYTDADDMYRVSVGVTYTF
ncbi:hypothetical protein FVE67_07610 [Thermosulfurimonas marina]|uniref:Alginate export domain-containing protein n=1 Tax=Thermosulfurimonas marina TaxID=2047767 RepID=A0A6H1WU04_9BACT|nr:hypothetical protein [Thermosulfurimonas marina]QJA06668.1 hypothetical protein FVE67_07610 [Thermosulfurimonas marina]